ncbi:MAG: TonB-dependent receptor [Myxococcaceae bacterium]|nr:TonB-dependent receptor [Myxococcaceae bacterium]
MLTKAPTLVQQVEAAYPPDAADAGVGGTVVMEIDLGEDGSVTDARVVGSAGPSFDESALKAVRQYKFTPAEVDGKPTAVRLQYSYTFFLRREVVEVAPSPDAGPVVNFSGRLIERGTRVPLAGAAVVIGGLEAFSNDEGYFEIEGVTPGTYEVVVSANDYERYAVNEEISPGKKTEVTYHVRKKVYGAYETVVRGVKERKEVAQVTLRQEEIRLIPGTNGDAFRVVQNLPGVARAPFGLGNLIVRGQKAWDTRTYVDETLVPQLFHFGGLYATYNSNLLETISFQPGNFGAQWGRAIGGNVYAEARTPAKNGYHGFIDVNVVDTSIMLEGPIGDDWSFSLSGRRSYIDALLPAVFDLIGPSVKNALSFTVAPRYYDYQARIEYRPKKGKLRFFVSFFGSDDKLALLLPNPAFDPEGRGTFGTGIAYNRLVVGLDYTFTDRIKLINRVSGGYDKLDVNIGSDIFLNGEQFPIQSRNYLEMELAPWLSLNAGLDLYMFWVKSTSQSPPSSFFKPNAIPDPYVSRSLVTQQTTTFYGEPAIFAEAVIKPLPSLKIVAGIRADYETYMKRGWIDPRLAVFWQPWEDITLKAAAGLYHQQPDHRVGTLSPVYGNPALLPEAAGHYMAGIEKRFSDAVTLDVQAYYKDLFHQVRSTVQQGAGTNLGDDPLADLRYTNVGRGRSYGMELLLRHQLTKNFFGWIAYSLSRAERDYKGGTVWSSAQYDQPHNLILIGSYKLPYDFIFGVRMRYVSGPLVTPINGSIYDANGNYFIPVPAQQEFTRRLPDFFQLDVRLDKRFVFKHWMLSLYLDVQNVTNQRNVEQLIYNHDFTKEAFITGLPILPVLGAKGEW